MWQGWGPDGYGPQASYQAGLSAVSWPNKACQGGDGVLCSKEVWEAPAHPPSATPPSTTPLGREAIGRLQGTSSRQGQCAMKVSSGPQNTRYIWGPRL